MNYTQYFCKECKFHSYDVFARGMCQHPDVCSPIEPYCIACFRFKLKEKKEKK